MAKIGSILQETRLRKGLTLERIADDTNISVRFLAKIENDDFTGFPGEPYVVGFIHNYADYLGFSPDDMVARYRLADEAAPAEGAGAPPTANTADAPKAAIAEDAPQAAAAEADGSAGGAQAEASASVPAQKPKRQRKAKADTAKEVPEAETDAVSSAAAFPLPLHDPAPESAAHPSGRQGRHASGERAPLAAPPPAPAPAPAEAPREKAAQPAPARLDGKGSSSRIFVVGALAIIILGAAVFWIVAGGRISGSSPRPKGNEPAEYRVEGGPFEKRLYVGDSLLVPLGDDVYKIKLAGIAEAVTLETPLGPLALSLGEAGPLDPDKDGVPNVSIVLGDFEKNRPASGALLRIEFAPPAEASVDGAEVTVPENSAQAGNAASQPKPDTVILKSSRGPYPFVVQVSFRGNCLFRYEVDRKEWVEKYFSKGETATINVSNGLTVWASNAQAAKMTFQASGGKTADLELGAPGEIAVKRIAWGRAEGSSALISSDLD
jgi:transcriptional regulator with XRE-family HTH domain